MGLKENAEEVWVVFKTFNLVPVSNSSRHFYFLCFNQDIKTNSLQLLIAGYQGYWNMNHNVFSLPISAAGNF